MQPRIYLDNNTTARPHPSAIDKMLPFHKNYWGSLMSPHQMGQELVPLYEDGMKVILQALGACDKDRFILQPSGADAISQLFFSHYVDEIRETGKSHIATSCIEDAATLMTLRRLDQLGCSGKLLPIDKNGQITADCLEEAIKPRTSLVSLSWANGLTGVVQPISELAEVCKKKGVRFHVDASHAIGKLFFRYQDMNIDYLTFDGSCIHAPKGTGGLLIKQGVDFTSLVVGERAYNMPGLIGLSHACHLAAEHFDHLCTEVARLRDRLETGIKEGFPDAVVFFQELARLPNCSAIAFPGILNEALLYALNRQGVYASFGGSHCQKLTSVLTASGVDEILSGSALSFSLSYETKEEEIDQAIEIIVSSAKKLRTFSQALI